MLDGLLFAKTPALLSAVYRECLWRVPTKEKVLYLTFDDGPIPEVTPFVLDELKKWNAKATFFCIGKNIVANPSVFQRIIAEGHTIGNHTYDHTNGWNAENEVYYNNIEQCASVLSKYSILNTQYFFRPPYGKLKPAQYFYLKERYKIVMWDVLSCDYDTSVSADRVLKNVLDNAEAGSVIVFHDSLKAQPRMAPVLPQVLEHFTAKGFKFDKL